MYIFYFTFETRMEQTLAVKKKYDIFLGGKGQSDLTVLFISLVQKVFLCSFHSLSILKQERIIGKNYYEKAASI